MCTVYGIGCDSGGGEEEEECRNLIAETNAVSSNEKIRSENNGEYVINGETLRKRLLYWQFARNGGGLFRWQYVSVDSATHKKVGTEWQWKSLVHLKEIKEVLGPVFGFEVDLSSITTETTMGVYYAGMKHTWTIKLTLICSGSPFYNNPGGDSAAIFYVDEG